MNDRLNILIVCQFFPPYNTPRSYRAYELSAELARLGHNVLVKALIGNHNYSDIEKDNYHIENIGKSKFGNVDADGNWNRNFIYRIMSHYLCYFEFPAIELMNMVNKALGDISCYDLIISVAFPYPVHWGVGRAIEKTKKELRPIWISDCGDPYMGNPMSHKFFLYKYVEKWWGNLTDYITIPIDSAKNAYFEDIQEKIRVIPQGFNFENISIDKYVPNPVPTFVYAGKVYHGTRDPSNFISYLNDRKVDFRFYIYTDDLGFFNKFRELNGIKLFIHNYIPRLELIKMLSRSDFIVNIQNTGTVQAPSKLIDYSLSKRPILNISSKFEEQDIVDEFIQGNYIHQLPPVNLDKYNIKNIAKQFLLLYKNNKTK